MRRRDFLAATSAAAALAACGSKAAPPLPPGRLTGANDVLGHRLRKPDFPAPTETLRSTVTIAGGGIGGLSAAWKLARSGCDDFLLLEMEGEAGGNSRAAKNAVSAHPLGAHYLPLPPREARATRQLLAELGVLQGDPEAAHPAYDEKYLCHAPQERLYKDGYWQEGVWPTLGVPAAERAQYTRFQDHVAALRRQRDAAGRRAFALPLALSSPDPQLRALDRLGFRDWLLGRGLHGAGPALAGRLCLPRRLRHGGGADLGLGRTALLRLPRRRGPGADCAGRQRLAGARTGARDGGAGAAKRAGIPRRAGRKEVACDVYLAAENRSIRVISRELIWAAPLFLIPHVFAAPRPEWLAAIMGADYAPWVVANLTLSEAPQTRAGQPLAWDNVLHDSPALGYVVATHQQLRYAPGPTVITWYRALHEESASRQRRLLQGREDWAAKSSPTSPCRTPKSANSQRASTSTAMPTP
jgi:hypothetical protein